MYSAVQRSVRAAMPCVSQHSRKRALSAANGRAGWRLVRLTSEASPRDSSGDLSPIFGADELGEMFRICCGNDHIITGCRLKRERLSGQYHINVQVFNVSSWSPLAPRLCPKS